MQILAAYVLFLCVAVVWPTLRVWRSIGHSPLVLPVDDSVEGFVGRAFKLTIVGLGIYLAGLAIGWFEPLGTFTLPGGGIREAVGWGLIGTSLAWIVLAQWQMGESWRIGIDHARPAPLVLSGLFRFSRNPIFLGVVAQLAGLVLLQPDAVTLLVLVEAYLLISVQIRMEERYLRSLHGAAYDAFAAAVRRWI